MGEANISWNQDQFSCPVCLDLLKDPVTIPCGHSYCMSCITGYWNQETQKRVYSCPQCRQTFAPRPALCKNVVFAEMVDKLRKTKLQSAAVSHCFAGPGDVECDVCTGRKHKAVKSCLECLNSYCHNHLEQHRNFFKGKRHNLIDASGRLKEMICPKHNKQLDIYCHTDQQCVCYLCTMDEHKHHETISAGAERTKRQEQLENTQREFKKRIQQEEKKVQELRKTVEFHKRSAQAAVRDSEKIFTELIRSIEKSCSEVTQLIRDQEKAAVSQAERLLKRLEQEIADLKRRDADLEQLSHTDDHIYFLQNFQSLSVPPKSTDVSSITVSSLLSYDDVGISVSLLRAKVEDICKDQIEKITGRVRCIEIIPTPAPRTRGDFLQYTHELTLDTNTAHKCLRLSEQNKAVTNTDTKQQYPDHPDRFNFYCQVLCRQSVCGRSYWEVEWSGSKGVCISVAYKSISRKGSGYECLFGCNDQSWRLFCSDSSYSFCHNNIETDLPAVSSSSRIGVYVDHIAGTLSFYNVSDTMSLIHRVRTTFTQPLYPGFFVNYRSTVRLGVM